MNISDFSKKTGLSPYTLRYYEKIGLIDNISRSDSGHRQYSVRDIEWISFISRLKETGMSLKNIEHYAKLRKQGQNTIDERESILVEHHKSLKKRIENEMRHLQALESKIAHYRSAKKLLT